jgi:trk system potassium uptake protein TrkH
VLTTTVGLLVYGVVSLWLAQSLAAERPGGDGGVVAAQGAAATFRDAGFMALTARTAGFNTVPMEDLAGPSRFVLVTLMTVGASPGGTGGGFKTTTLALLVLMVAATIRRREEVEAFGRAISLDFTRRAATIAFTFVCLIVLVVLLLRFSESAPFEVILFEAVSATSTTGLSLGLTPDLTPFGKVVIIAAMFLGRVGPLALLAALFFGGSAPRPYAYPHEPVIMG